MKKIRRTNRTGRSECYRQQTIFPTKELSPFVKLRAVRVGAKLVTDGGFTCIKKGAVLTVREDRIGKYILCAKGHHYLYGQPQDDGMLAGLSRAP